MIVHNNMSTTAMQAKAQINCAWHMLIGTVQST